MSAGSVCRHLKIVGRVAISRFFHLVTRGLRKLQHNLPESCHSGCPGGPLQTIKVGQLRRANSLGFDCHLDQRATLAQYLLSIVLMSYSTNECLYQCSELVSVLYERNPGVIDQVVANLEAVSSGSATLLCEEKIQSRTPISFCAKG